MKQSRGILMKKLHVIYNLYLWNLSLHLSNVGSLKYVQGKSSHGLKKRV